MFSFAWPHKSCHPAASCQPWTYYVFPMDRGRRQHLTLSLIHIYTVLLEENIKAKLGQLEDKSNEEIEAALNEVVEEGTVCISINMNPVFSSGKAEGTLKKMCIRDRA